MRSIILSVLVLFLYGFVEGQPTEFIPKGKFWKDSLMVGETVQYSISYTYPQETELVFPDSMYNFFPFEFVSKTYFPTKVDSTLLTDSVIYTLRTFEMDSILYLRIPVFIIDEEGDSLNFYTAADSVIFNSAIKEMPEKPELKANTNYTTVEKQFNYIYFIIGVAIVLIVIGVCIAIFGRRVYQWYKVNKLKRAHKKFQSRYLDIMKSVSTQNSKEITAEILSVWKKYMEKTEKMPITKYTSKEISKAFTDQELRLTLRELDKNIYGNYKPENIKSYYEQLLQFSTSRLHQKIEEVKYG